MRSGEGPGQRPGAGAGAAVAAGAAADAAADGPPATQQQRSARCTQPQGLQDAEQGQLQHGAGTLLCCTV